MIITIPAEVGEPKIKAKECKKCGKLKPIEDFYKNSCCADGYENICKRCRKLQKKENYRAKKQIQEKSNIIKKDNQPTKKCRKCGEVKPITEFYRDKRYADGYENICKECRNIQQQERRRTYKKCLWCGRKLAPSAFYSSEDIYCKKCMLERLDKKEWVKDSLFVLRKEGKDYVPPRKEELEKLPKKVCRRCGNEYPIAYFSKNKSRPDGYDDYCKECRRRINKLSYRKHWKENISRRRKYHKQELKWRLYHREYLQIRNHDYKKDRKKEGYYYPLEHLG